MISSKVKLIVTLGPATHTEADLRKIKDKGVDFVRVNMSHSSIEDLRYFIDLSIKVGIPFIIDTEGSQVRTGKMKEDVLILQENDKVKICVDQKSECARDIHLKPSCAIDQLEESDLIHIDFDTVILRVTDTSTLSSERYIIAEAITGGKLGSNKAVAIYPALPKKINLPTLTDKDHQAIALGLEKNIKYIAVSFVRSGDNVSHVRKLTQGSMKIISKIECTDALENLDDIIDESDYLLIDRGDLSKEVPIVKIPFIQKIILHKASKKATGVFVATNLLETMVENKNPTRAVVHDTIATIMDGAYGLTLAAETAIGRYPMECINMINRLSQHVESYREPDGQPCNENIIVKNLIDSDYLTDHQTGSPLVLPHGGRLINRTIKERPSQSYLDSLFKIEVDQAIQMDIEQIAIGTYSPLQGFMEEEKLRSVIDTMRLPNGVIWPLPVVLDVSIEQANNIVVGRDIALTDSDGQVIATMNISEKYRFNGESVVKKIYGTDSDKHPGVRKTKAMKPVLLAGKVSLIQRRNSETKQYELTPRQTRRLFEERGWAKVVGFHTRNVIHRSHEFIQIKTLEEECCDGLFVHPVIGQKKRWDFHAKYIINSYKTMMKHFYPKGKVIFATLATYSRYAGPREALFTAICRKNFGCSHFIIGRDHTGVKQFYEPYASHNIFDQYPDLGMKIIKFGKVFYSNSLKKYLHEKDFPGHEETDKNHISGTEARAFLAEKKMPPEWFMRPEIASTIISSIDSGEEVFVQADQASPV
jgi:pyruvate kinase